ncbi:protein asteroid homolog 1 [Amphiprion ocellaris]|uniref:Asteroid domain-containing protein n=1 Tax=Amphiprion ocellaris TaxID=80972 RepID=A0A3Q1D1P0_AMPOC|nr:protein asteroid homolog 1 [Amphiprion ocellaris]XP_023133857.2 protein asteroid homolog 1 [Amphiprion ocellaris]XP_023133859.2 protein asteroid homolog 1 [Amphiprion ocellaris]XP_054873885.1 protein asteroid homolog 1 [Amphiprion ocellaris]
MGVQGLTTYVEGNRYFFQDVKFRDSRLVIDGCSLYFRLYFNSGFDQQHGGEYSDFACLLSQFLSALAACNIQPYVVLDGGIDPSDKKFPTLRQRLQSKIKEADSISHGRNGSVLPILSRNVFIQVLIEKGVPLVQCSAEADWEIACLAHQWNCPVLTNDSDFYIFDLPGGYLPLRFFQWTNLNGKASHRYISARCYTTSSLCRLFGGMNRELLPLCAVLTGNDYGVPKDVEALLAQLDLSAGGAGGGRSKGGAYMSRVEGILLWLSNFSTVANALDEVSKVMREESSRGKRGQKGGLSSQLWARMQEYHIKGRSSLARWFSGVKAVPEGQTSRLAQLPECLSLAAMQGLLAPLVVDAFVMRRVLLMPQVENSKLASSHCSSRDIRQALYGILLQRPQDSTTQARGGGAQLVKGPQGEVQTQDMWMQLHIRQGMRGGRGRGGRGSGGRGQGHIVPAQQGVYVAFSTEQAAGAATVPPQSFSTPICVEEYDRLDLNLKKNQVEAHPPRNHLHLDGLGQAPVAARLNVLFEVLGVKDSALAPVPLHLQLAVAVTGFWLREAIPKPSELQLQALVLGMVYGELFLIHQPGAMQYQHPAPQINWAAECKVWEGLNRQRVRSGDRRGMDLGAAHSFSQWQACLWSALCLNQLLLFPLPEPNLSWLFSGTLVHGLLRCLKGGRPAESLLSGGSFAVHLYFSLLGAVMNCSFKANPSSSASGRKKRGRGRGRRGRGGGGRGAQGGGRDAQEINNRFALLMSEEEYDSGD